MDEGVSLPHHTSLPHPQIVQACNESVRLAEQTEELMLLAKQLDFAQVKVSHQLP